jgi:hypothetical protein
VSLRTSFGLRRRKRVTAFKIDTLAVGPDRGGIAGTRGGIADGAAARPAGVRRAV